MIFLLLLGCLASPDSKPAGGGDTGPGVETGDSAVDTGETGDTGDTGETGDTGDTEVPKDADGDGLPFDVDCDDANPDVGAAPTWYGDGDRDGYGDAAIAISVCDQPPTFVSNALDCDDSDDAVSPAATEICSGRDEDCDGAIDDADSNLDPSTATTWYVDSDGDGHGDASSPLLACALPDGASADATDCDDTDPAISPDAIEVCGGGDEDCDGLVDDADPSLDESSAGALYTDADGDGWGGAATGTYTCVETAGTSWLDGDCDDSDSGANPDAVEVCGGADEDCDGLIDDADPDATGQATWYADTDADGFGDPAASAAACASPVGFVSDATDCDGTDNATYPGATEVCDGRDQDCDDIVDNGATDMPVWYADADGDSFGDAATSVAACDAPSGYVSDGSDCDDTDAAFAAICPLTGCDTLVPYPGDISFSGSGASSAFAAFCTSYNEIAGDLTLQATDAVTLTDLSCLCEVDGDVFLQHNTALLNLDGLERLTSISGSLNIDDNDLLTDLTGLGSLESIGGDLALLSTNALVSSYAGLSALSTIGGSLNFRTNGIADLSGLEALASVGGDLTVQSSAVTDLSALATLQEVGGKLTIRDNESLTSLSALDGLTQVGALTLTNNDYLTSLTGLEDLHTIDGTLLLYSVDGITDLTGLDGLSSVGSLSVQGMAHLSSFDGLGGLTAVPGSVYLFNNVIDSFSGLDAISEIGGALTIQQNTTDPDADPDVGFSGLSIVDGDVMVQSNPSLPDLTLLSSLRALGGALIVKSNPSLDSLTGLERIRTVPGDVAIYDNGSLLSWEGLNGLTTVGGNLGAMYIGSGTTRTYAPDYVGLDALTRVGGDLTLNATSSFDGLESLTEVDGSLFLGGTVAPTGLDALTTVGGSVSAFGFTGSELSGLDALTTVGRNVALNYVSSLGSISGFGALDAIGGQLEISNCSGLGSVTGFTALETIGSNLNIYQNGLLTDVSGLMGIGSVGGGLSLYENGLSTAQAEALRDAIGTSDISGAIYIYE